MILYPLFLLLYSNEVKIYCRTAYYVNEKIVETILSQTASFGGTNELVEIIVEKWKIFKGKVRRTEHNCHFCLLETYLKRCKSGFSRDTCCFSPETATFTLLPCHTSSLTYLRQKIQTHHLNHIWLS